MKSFFNFITIILISLFLTELKAQDNETNRDTTASTQADTTQVAKSALDMPVDYVADDSIVFSLVEKKMYLHRNAKIVYGQTELKADYIEYNMDSSQVYACGVMDSTGVRGKPEFKDGDDNYTMDQIWYNFKTKKALIKGIITEQNDGYLHSGITKMQTSGDIHICDGKYTTCDLEHPHFYIALTRAIVKKEKNVVSGPLYFVIEDVPLPIGLPFGFFPSAKKRGSGFILPTYGEETSRGFFIRNGGYYSVVNDHWDVALTGEIFSNGTYGLRGLSRYSKRYKFDGSVDMQYQSYVGGEKGLPDYSKYNSYQIKWTHSQAAKANPYQKFTASVNFETNSFSEKNATTHSQLQNTEKSSNISYSRNRKFNFTSSLSASQNTKTKEVVLKLPVMNLNFNPYYPFQRKNNKGESKWWEQTQIKYSSDFTNTLTTKDSLLFKNETLKDFKTGYKHSIPITIPIKIPKVSFITLSPSLSYTGVLNTRYINKTYHENYTVGDTTYQNIVITDTIHGVKYAHQYDASISLSMTPTWYGMYQFKPNWIRSRIEAIRHVISPSVSFSYKPESVFDDSYYRPKVQKDTTGVKETYDIFQYVGAYSSPSASAESGSLSFGLRNTLEMKVRDKKDSAGTFKKVKILENLNFSSSYNILADSMALSKISFSGSTNILEKIKISFSGSFNPYAYNEVTGKDVKEYFYQKHQPMRLESFRTSVGMDFKSSTDTKGRKVEEGHVGDGIYDVISDQYVDFSIPWSFRVDYTFGHNKSFDSVFKKIKGKNTMSTTFSGNFSLTPKWKATFRSGYNFDSKEFTSTSFGFERDLHCWIMTFNWIPFGRIQSYDFRIAIRSSVFDGVEYKIDKRNY